jgi:hypothetical protein
MSVSIDPELQALIHPLSEAEYAALEQSIVANGGARDPVVVWGDTLLDGHNRVKICAEHGLPEPRRVGVECADFEAARAWMLANQLARRNLSRAQVIALAVLAGMPIPNPTGAMQESLAKQLAGDEEGRRRLAQVRDGKLPSIQAVHSDWRQARGEERRKPRTMTVAAIAKLAAGLSLEDRLALAERWISEAE